MHTTNLSPTAAVKSCFRCGTEFPTSDRERVCWRCRKPKAKVRGSASKELTFRESQIVDLVAQGKTNKEVAFHLLLTEGTIKEYLNRIFRKAGVSNRTELAIWSLTQRPAVGGSQPDDTRFESRPAFEKSSMII